MAETVQTNIEVVSVTFADDVLAARGLFAQYRLLLGGQDLEQEGIEQEIARLPFIYTESGGDVLLACLGRTPAGSIALRGRGPAEGELKRLFVVPGFRGQGVGRALVEAALARAWALGMNRVCLDTLPSMREAQALYSSCGFVPCEAYGGKSDEDTLFFELRRPA